MRKPEFSAKLCIWKVVQPEDKWENNVINSTSHLNKKNCPNLRQIRPWMVGKEFFYTLKMKKGKTKGKNSKLLFKKLGKS